MKKILKDLFITLLILSPLIFFIDFSGVNNNTLDFSIIYSKIDVFVKFIAIPIMFGDLILSFIFKDGHHLKGDSFSNLIVGGVRSFLEPALILGVYVHIYLYCNQLTNLSINVYSPINWIICLILLDLAYYWDHRISHKIKFFWANHSIHHSGTRLNFLAATRGSWIEGIYRWIFRAPIALVGFPPLMIVLLFRILRFYQMFQHSDRYKGEWSYLRRVIATPEFHRLHHGVDRKYHDANYGGFLSLWDHIYGTSISRDGDEKIIYGVTYPIININNPLSVVFSPLVQYFRGLYKKND
jgi:sterol desaturase/sphingolipid hydroxylase (fatty acid hydroxylase superfamily)